VSKQVVVMKLGQAESLAVMGSQIRLLCDGARTGDAWSLMHVTIPRDSGPPPHHHEWDEAYFITDGALRFVVDGRIVVAEAGDFVFIPGNTVHGFHGASDDAARALLFAAPPHADQFFRDTANEVREMPRDLAKVPEIGARHGITFLPPPPR
jgi:quercetin dioxygenase-like cupin family protein